MSVALRLLNVALRAATMASKLLLIFFFLTHSNLLRSEFMG
jgi:hypothetical protein